MRALIAEDEFLGRKVLAAFLNALFEVDLAVNGKEAVLAFLLAHEEGRPYDLILMDIMMPEMDGIQALTVIRAREQEMPSHPHVKVLMTTALDDPKNVVEAYYKGGATSYVPKPIDKHMLLHLIKTLGLIE